MTDIAQKWNTAYFDGRLPTGVLAELRNLSDASPDAQALADRALRLMRAARIGPDEVSLLAAWMIGFAAPRTVPSAWSGAVPPVTMAGRHRKLDEYVAGNPWHQPAGGGVFVDLGCGFPPFTTIDTARHLPDWRVIGVDPAFGEFLVYDADGAYACFDENHRLRYYQSGNFDPDQASTRAKFEALLARLLSDPADESGRLVRNPVRQYETGNLELAAGGVGEFELPGGADVIRCMNVFMYFDHDFRQRAVDWAATQLRPGGLFLCGNNWEKSAASRYTVYRKENDRLVAREFAFSVENIRPIELAPWYALHDDNLETLANAHAVGTIRADEQFRQRFDARMDGLLVEFGLSKYVSGAPADMPADVLSQCSATLARRLDDDGFAEGAAAVLRQAGREAWRNHVGHVAMTPVTPPALPLS